MNFSLRYGPAFPASNLRRGVRASQTITPPTGKEKDGLRRRFFLKAVDKELSKGNFQSAVKLVTELQGKPGGLIGFGAAKQVPTIISDLEEFNITETEISSVEALVDSIVDSIKRCIGELDQPENPVDDENYSSPEEKHLMCVQHEAGHFLAAYLLGVIPRAYRLPSVEAVKQEDVGGSIDFPFGDFLAEVDKAYQSRNNPRKGKKASKSKVSFPGLQRFVCVTLGGLVAEHLVFGRSMGLHFDVRMLGSVLGSLGFTADEAFSLTRWATLNTVLMLQRHGEARSSLAEAMAQGRSVGVCIDTIENNLNDEYI